MQLYGTKEGPESWASRGLRKAGEWYEPKVLASEQRRAEAQDLIAQEKLERAMALVGVVEPNGASTVKNQLNIPVPIHTTVPGVSVDSDAVVGVEPLVMAAEPNGAPVDERRLAELGKFLTLFGTDKSGGLTGNIDIEELSDLETEITASRGAKKTKDDIDSKILSGLNIQPNVWDTKRRGYLQKLEDLSAREIPSVDYKDWIEALEKKSDERARRAAMIAFGRGIAGGSVAEGLGMAGEAMLSVQEKYDSLLQELKLAQLRGDSEAEIAKIERDINIAKVQLGAIPDPPSVPAPPLIQKLHEYRRSLDKESQEWRDVDEVIKGMPSGDDITRAEQVRIDLITKFFPYAAELKTTMLEKDMKEWKPKHSPDQSKGWTLMRQIQDYIDELGISFGPKKVQELPLLVMPKNNS